MLRRAGLVVRPISNHGHKWDVERSPDDVAMSEGNLRLVAHLRRERSRHLVIRKKKQMFDEYDHLFCEKCGFVPREKYGELGDACIEVHHAATQLAHMRSGHLTRIDDLECLCANCRRVEHAGL